jgi:predicted Zn-dependent protease
MILALAAGTPLVKARANGDVEMSPSSRPAINSELLQQDIQEALTIMDDALAKQEETSPEDEYYLGRGVAANILKQYKPYLEDPELTDYLNTICGALVFHSKKPVIFNGYHVMILDTPEINAFATSGGHIFVTRGMIGVADSEDALAGVIAHEIAHIQLRHGVQIVENMRLAQDLSSAAERSSLIASRSPEAQQIKALFNSSVREMINVMVINGYSQVQEFEADEYALSLLAGAGYNPSSLIDALRSLEIRQPQQAGGFNKTHPSPSSRISNIEQTVQTYRTPDTRSFRVDRFQGVK